MRLEDLDYFLAVARSGHVGRAAEQLGVSQPALTKGIRRLEEELRLQLFNRTPKGMELTLPGQAFYQRSQQARLGLDDALREAADLHRGTVGLVRVGVTPLLAEHFFNPACVELLAQRPAARFSVTVNLNDALLTALRQGELDFMVCSLHESTLSSEFERMPLFPDNLYVAARASHPLFNRSRIVLADLAQYRWLLPGPQVAARRWLETRFEQRGAPPPEVVIESNAAAANLVSILLNTDLLTLTSEITLRSSAGRNLGVVPLEDVTWHREIGILAPRGSYRSPLAQRLIDILTDHAAAWRKAPG
ncbi:MULTISPECIES: LysR family transcriptional regulator [unclassified Achromobacter]|uniref:LysR family transcriptional regulator n=1 Tax=unclassified Achromobacter TaxID=2626865 RepID=UPI000B516639|nr:MULTISPECIES: LysR family transcriptional regulator [unclassified Achromobacter]OWT72874.1 LysR family transcriptional regulator [Achromobacter sp. HZ34]OWT74092.1 LysR family transcriptional regulator [Achromobacter sp. HZ28]